MTLWQNVVEGVGKVSPFARTYLLEAHPVALSKSTFTIGFDPEFADHVGLVDNAKNRTIIQTKLRELDAGDVHVKFVVAPSPEGWARVTPPAPPPEEPTPAAPAPARSPAASPEEATKAQKLPSPQPPKAEFAASPEDFKNDPLIKEALEIFKATIVEVRG